MRYSEQPAHVFGIFSEAVAVGLFFLADLLDIDVGKSSGQRGFSVEHYPHVVGIVEIAHQRGIGKHGHQYPAQRFLPGLLSSVAFQKTKRLLHQIVGPLRLDHRRTGWRVDCNGIGKEFIPILVNLFHHFLVTDVACR